jgi:hypothetical protein
MQYNRLPELPPLIDYLKAVKRAMVDFLQVHLPKFRRMKRVSIFSAQNNNIVKSRSGIEMKALNNLHIM